MLNTSLNTSAIHQQIHHYQSGLQKKHLLSSRKINGFVQIKPNFADETQQFKHIFSIPAVVLTLISNLIILVGTRRAA